MSNPNDPHRRPNPPQVNPQVQPGEGPGTSQTPGVPQSGIPWNGQSAGTTQPGGFGQQPQAPGQEFQSGQQPNAAAQPPYRGRPGPAGPAGPAGPGGNPAGPVGPAGPGGGPVGPSYPGAGSTSYPGGPAQPNAPGYPGGPSHPGGPSYPAAPGYPGGAGAGQPGAGGNAGYPGAGNGSGYPGAGGNAGYPGAGNGSGYPGAGGGPGFPGGPGYGGGPAGPGGPQPPKKGKGGLIAGLVIGGFLILALIVGGGIWGVSQFTAAPDPEPTESDTTQAPAPTQPSPDTTPAGDADPEVGIGDCIREPSGPRLEQIDCEEPHYGQVYAQKKIEGESYPGDSQLDADARTFCQSGASGALDPAKLSADYVASFAYPTPETWANAEQRYIHCVVLRADGSDFTEDLLPSS